ncbi:expressed protein [Echinococcus multilocularis]|uniref:Expressed protein n=1 Tax=Echinococcus multilocularis TaxID=6211 RepID=A0A068YDS4_ECHMU|nr:expressed protein [Echinococcus multilocularis]
MQLYNAQGTVLTTEVCTIPVTQLPRGILMQKPFCLQVDNAYCNSSSFNLYNLGSGDKYRCGVDLNTAFQWQEIGTVGTTSEAGR